MSKIGYIIVSTEHQETARQQEIMCDYQVDRIFSEKISGANKDRPQLKAMLDYVREGDTLYIESISRLGRSTKDLLNIIDTLTEKCVTLISHKENIDTDTPAGKFMLTVFAALSQLEREQLKQRQREGIEIAKAQGKYTGRKPIEIDWTRFGQYSSLVFYRKGFTLSLIITRESQVHSHFIFGLLWYHHKLLTPFLPYPKQPFPI